MKILNGVLLFFVLMMFAPLLNVTFAQSEPILYFCERYDASDGEIGVSDRFTTGYLTVMVKSDNELRLDDVSIQFDKYNSRNGKFEYFKKFAYNIQPDMSYVYFSKNDESDMKFSDPGFYRVFLLDDRDKTVASALIEIIK
ncbi:MAG: hypothetical protein KJN64_10655 [Ignavibacteria bacterium]|nr:hypothetical protein [Ignavibacteria bacterium]MBT8380847.1 hypothetical protein [Ignavibacteria bacterium]MBT8390542.1 hypothetical protein [Ignavibacteria bacterium]NNJ52834.1 hypothetical protein [Ignavibacteriaceae bacterium]NNL21526.1 hypothetical protein [Ignavibacteriaceae bacterium]